MLQVFAVTVMVIPADTVIRAVGGEGYAAGLLALLMFAAYLAAVLFGLHNPLHHRHPIRGVICFFWISVLISYVVFDRRMASFEQITAADRKLQQCMIITGVVLIAAECLNSLSDIRRVLRALTWGGAFCGVVAALQFWAKYDVTPYLRDLLPGFSINFDNPAIVDRGGLGRVQGTSTTAIELGVVAGMLLPIAIAMALHDDPSRPAWKRWGPVLLIGVSIPASVSRSGIISIFVAGAVLLALMPPRQRLLGLIYAPFGLVATFMSAPGVLGTLLTFFKAGKSDDSVMARVIDYPEVARLVVQSPWLGHGGGTYLPADPIFILDNEWLRTAIELGMLGFVMMLAYFLVPFVCVLVARKRSDNPEFRMLCAALAGAALAAGVCSITFDSMSFPMFYNVHALVLGLIGAAWRLTIRGGPLRAETASGRAFRGRPAFATETVVSAGG